MSKSTLVKSGKLSRIHQGIYTDASMVEVAERLCQNPLAAYRTAYELRSVNGHIFIVADVKKRKQIVVASALTIDLFPGNTDLLTEQFVPGLARRALMQRT